MKNNYFEDVYAVVRLIPAGKVTNYGAIAEYLGLRAGARMVGWAMNAAHTMLDVPAHRVVNRNGVLTGKAFFDTPTTMQERLEAEGLCIKNDKIQDFDSAFWHPSESLV